MTSIPLIQGGPYEGHAPNEIRLHGAFLALTETFYLGPEVRGDIGDCMVYGVGMYTPRVFRRARLKRWAPIAQRWHLTRARTCAREATRRWKAQTARQKAERQAA